MIRRITCIISFALVLSLPHLAFSGDLEKFESAVTDSRGHGGGGGSGGDDDDDDLFDDIFGDMIGELLTAPLRLLLNGGGQTSFYREGVGNAANDPGFEAWRRHPGERLIPRARIDVAYQKVEDDIDAFDIRAEGGYGAFGAQARHTRMHEKDDGSLSATYFHLLWRMSFWTRTEVDFGAGIMHLAGREDSTGGSLMLPIQYHREYFGIELRPAWSHMNGNVVSDYDAAVVVGPRYAAVRAGYRWLLAHDESLQGPYAGVSFSW